MAFQALFCILLLICLYSHIAQSNSVNECSTTLEFLNQLGGIKKGDNVKSVYELKNYLSYLGYLNHNGHSNDHSQKHENVFDDSLEIAIKKYQESHDLNITGLLDANTITKMHQTRCGMPDFSNPNKSFPFNTESHYSFFEGKPKWNKKNLSYAFNQNVFKEAQQPLKNALNEWASKTPFKFYYVKNMNQADIKFSFVRWDRADALAHSLPPPDGRVNFDVNRSWSYVPKKDFYDMQTVALHELGHVLGLSHSTEVNAVMYPTVRTGVRKRLHKDDINGIKALYKGK
ncbi:hypothetical protein ABFX02_04G165000 [Erythranthe guttata]